MREINKLSARTVATAADGMHSDGNGLYLIVDKGNKRWAFIFQWRGRRKEMGLGPIADVSLKEARDLRDGARKLVRAGVNPIDDRKRDSSLLFSQVAEELIDELAKGWSPNRGARWKTSLKLHAPAIWNKPVADIETDDILATLKPIWSTKPDMAGKVRGRIERVLDAAKAKGLRTGENPARWRGHLKLMLAEQPKLSRGHHPALPYAEIAGFMAVIGSRPALACRALEFTILTAVRTNEALGARWDEFDLKQKVWTIPKERMKRARGQQRREHRVPLNAAMLKVIGEGGDGYVFPGMKRGKPLSNMAMEMVLRRIDRDDITVHGFRSTFRDWAGEETEFPREIIEQALAHKVGSDVEVAYRRGDALERRRALMEAWAAYCYPALR